MSRGVFSADFASVFEDVLNIHFEDFPSGSGQIPDPKRVVEVQDTPELPKLEFLVDEFELELPDAASPNALLRMSIDAEPFKTELGAVSVDYGPLYAPGGSGGGKPGGGDGGDTGGGGKPDKGGAGGGGNTPAVSYTSGSDDKSGLNIELQFYGDWTSAAAVDLIGYMQAAAEFLSDIIASDMPDDVAMFNSFDLGTQITVDDLLIEVYLGNLKGGVVAQTDIYAANDWDLNGTAETFTGAKITFNKRSIDSVDGLGVLDDTALHEILHALGFGYWSVAENSLTKTEGGQILYTGAGATDWIVENEGLVGSVGGHWAEAIYGNELMTSELELADVMFLDYSSVATLQDLAVRTAEGGGYMLAADWQAQVDALNGTAGNEIGIDLDAWAASTLA